MNGEVKGDVLNSVKLPFTVNIPSINDIFVQQTGDVYKRQHNALFYKHVPEEEVFRLCFRFATEEDNPQEVLSLLEW